MDMSDFELEVHGCGLLIVLLYLSECLLVFRTVEMVAAVFGLLLNNSTFSWFLSLICAFMWHV